MNSDQVGGSDAGGARLDDARDDAVFDYPEFLIEDREFPPCGEILNWSTGEKCHSKTRMIVFVQANNSKKMVCSNYHLHLFEGKAWIPSAEFGPDGEFANILPRELQPDDEQIKSSRWKIPKPARERLKAESECANCSAPPFPIYQSRDTVALWEWITEYDHDLLSLIHSDLRKKAGADMREWYANLSVALRMKVVRRINQSPLHIDHGIPKKIADANWHLLSRSSRRFLQHNLLFALCKKCNGSKSSKLFDRERVVEMFVATYYDGSIAAAQHDRARWTVLQETLRVIYEQRQIS